MNDLIKILEAFLRGLIKVILKAQLFKKQRKVLFECKSSPRVLSQSIIASDNVLEQPCGGLL